MPVQWTQVSFRISADDGDETSANYLYALNSNGGMGTGINFRIRFLIRETGTTAGTLTPNLYYNVNGGAYTRVNADGTYVRPSLSPYFTEGAPTSRSGNPRALSTAGGFVVGSMDEVDAGCATTGTIIQGSETEIEFCLRLQAADVIHGTLIGFRVRNGTSALHTYTNTPSITAQEATSTASLGFTFGIAATSELKVLATAASLLFAIALGVTAPLSTAATGDLSFSPSIAAVGDADVIVRGDHSMFAYWFGGAGNPSASGTGSLTFEPATATEAKVVAKAATTLSYSHSLGATAQHQLIQGWRSPLAYWLGGAADAPEVPIPVTGTASLSFNFYIAGGNLESGFRSPLAYWLGGGASKDGVLSTATNLTFVHEISATNISGITGKAGGPTTLAWDANTEPDLAGYRLYYSSTQGGPYSLYADVGNVVTYVVTLSRNVYYFVVRAYDTTALESPDSNEVEVSFGGLQFSPSITVEAVTGFFGPIALAYSSSLDSVAKASATGTAGLSFDPSLAAEASHWQYVVADTVGLSFDHSLDSEGGIEQTGTAGITFEPELAIAAYTGCFGPINISFTFSSQSSAKCQAWSTAGLTFAFSEDVTVVTAVSGTGTLEFTFAIISTNVPFKSYWTTSGNTLIMDE